MAGFGVLISVHENNNGKLNESRDTVKYNEEKT